jgi:hypothetical protein
MKAEKKAAHTFSILLAKILKVALDQLFVQQQHAL